MQSADGQYLLLIFCFPLARLYNDSANSRCPQGGGHHRGGATGAPGGGGGEGAAVGGALRRDQRKDQGQCR